MNTNFSITSQPISRIAPFRRNLLRIHGTILSLVALASAVASTIGWITGTGFFGFMQQTPMVWVFAFQAYFLMTIIAVLLILGSNHADTRKWHVVGALAECAPMIVAFSSLDVFASMGRGAIAWVPISFHVIFFCLEAFAALYPDQHSMRNAPSIKPSEITMPEPGLSAPTIYRITAIAIFLMGTTLHGINIVIGPDRFLADVFSPKVDLIFALMMIVGAVTGWMSLKRLTSRGFVRVFYWVALLVITISIPIHVRSVILWSTAWVHSFPKYMSHVEAPMFLAFAYGATRFRFTRS